MKTKYKILMMICFWAVGFNITAQNLKGIITGSVTDSASNEKVFNATVTLINNTNNVAIFNTFSDLDGSFSFKNIDVGEYKISTRILGYSVNISKLITIGENHLTDSVFIHLQSKDVALEEVSVTATSLKPFTEMIDGKIIVNVAKNPLSTGDNAFDILLRSPGISEQGGSLSFRGKTVNVLIEGKLLHLDEGELKNMLNSMPANSIESIEIMANPPAKYDSNGGSLINIILAKTKRNGLNGSVLSGIGSGVYMKWIEGINLYYRSKKLNVFSSYDFEINKQYIENRRTINYHENDMFQRDYETRKRENNTYKIGFDYDFNRMNKIGFMCRGGVNTIDFLGDITTDLFANNIKSDSSKLSKDGMYKSFSTNVGMYYNLKLDSIGRQLSLSVDYVGFDKHRNSNFLNGNNEFLKLPFLANNSMSDINSYSWSLDYTHPSKIGKFEMGLKFQKNISDNINSWQKFVDKQWIPDTTKSNHFIYRENINAAYLSYSKVFSTKFNLRCGIRTEQTIIDGLLKETNENIAQDYVSFFPNLSFEYKKNIDNVFSVDYRRSIDRFGFEIRNPFVNYQGQNLYSQGNSKIQPQINNNYELTYTYKQNFVFGMSYTLTENAISALFVKGNNDAVISTYGNQKNAELFYVYTSATSSFIPAWTMNIDVGTGYLKYDTNIDLAGKYSPTWSYRLEMNNSIQLFSSWNIQINGVLLGPYSTGLYKAESNFTSTLGIGKTILKSKGNINFSVKDIFNTNQQTTYFENNNLYTNQFTKKESRFVTLTFSYKFGKKKEKTKLSKVKTASEVESRINE